MRHRRIATPQSPMPLVDNLELSLWKDHPYNNKESNIAIDSRPPELPRTLFSRSFSRLTRDVCNIIVAFVHLSDDLSNYVRDSIPDAYNFLKTTTFTNGTI